MLHLLAIINFLKNFTCKKIQGIKTKTETSLKNPLKLVKTKEEFNENKVLICLKLYSL